MGSYIFTVLVSIFFCAWKFYRYILFRAGPCGVKNDSMFYTNELNQLCSVYTQYKRKLEMETNHVER